MNGISRKRQSSEYNFPRNVKVLIENNPAKENIPPQFTQAIGQVGDKVILECTGKESESITPKKSRQKADEPVTPNTNFKLLTSLAATLDYANCSTPKSSRSCETLDSQISCDSDVSELSATKANRKEKSLAIICTRFLSMYPINPSADKKIIVSLDEACINLGVERRRLYDIVNVFESIDILTKTAKNQYLWFGKNNLIHSLQKLKSAAVKERILEKLQYVLKTEYSSVCKQSCILNEVQNFRTFDSPGSLFPVTSPPELRREKSLGIMSQKFLMLFLVSPEKIISLGVAAKVLNGFLQRNEKSTQIKTQIRRLYDIANVLSSIGLIQKEVAFAHHGKKPAFKYIGPNLENMKDDSAVVGFSSNKQNMKSRSLIRHSSFQEICAVAEIEHQKLNLEESHNSAPPFDSELADKKGISKTTFENLNFNNIDFKNPRLKSGIQEIKPEVPSPITVKPNLKLNYFTRPVGNSNNPCYILSNVVTEKKNKISNNNVCGTQAYLLINTVAPSKEVKLETSQHLLNTQISNSQTILLSSQQRDAILQSLNISLSPEQIASIHLDGSSPVNYANSNCNVLKIMNKNSLSKIAEDKSTVKLSSQKDSESVSNGCVSVNSTRNNSPNSIQALDSPLSIPSGYVTPIPTASSDMSFVPTIEVNDILKRIEGQTSFNVFSGKINPCNQNNKKVSLTNMSLSVAAKDNVNISLQSTNLQEKLVNNQHPASNGKIIDAENRVNQFITNDSCSSDSTNLEISSIFKGKGLSDASLKPKAFLIDEKTILSPIKNTNGLPQITVPANLMTPPYVGPETIFVFTTPSGSYQNSKVTISGQTTILPNSVFDSKKV